MSVSGISGGLDIEGLVAQYRSIEIIPRTPLEDRQLGLESRRDALTSLNSKLSALYTQSDKLSDSLSRVFEVKNGSSSNEYTMTLSASATAQSGSHSYEINRLASTDVRVSDQYTGAGSDFTAIVTDQSFDILVAHPLDGDENNTVAVTVTVAAASFAKTNEGLFNDIASAINSAIDTAVANEDILVSERVTATEVEESSGTTRLSMRSGVTGELNALQFTDTDGLLATLSVTASQVASGTSGGYITVSSQLDAEFLLDGLTFTRSTNTVEDALDGVTLTLLDTTSVPETLTVSSDVESVKTEVNSFIENYNDVLEYLASETVEGGAFRGDSTFGQIRLALRSMISKEVTGASSSEYTRLFHIGIETQTDGTLKLADESKLETALAKDTNFVSDIFDASDGMAVTIKDYVYSYTRASGLISSTKRSIAQSLVSQEDRLELFDDRLERKVNSFRDEMIRLQSAMSEVQSQAAFFSSFGR
ncbi:flagellar filament capping protein FliD [Candidatus Neomarinimicrobiota bacterium]